MAYIWCWQNAKDISDKFVAMQGLMEKLPMNKKKATLLKTWKRRFFKAEDGWLYYYEVKLEFNFRSNSYEFKVINVNLFIFSIIM